jgi:hypothetical protein
MHPGRQQLLLSGSAGYEVSIDWDLAPNPSPAVAKSLTGYWIGTRIHAPRQATAAVYQDQQQA